MGKWISPNLSQAEDFECLGHSNWTICSHLHISDFSNMMKNEVRLGYPNLTLQNKPNLTQLLIRPRGLGAWGFQTGPFAAY